VKEKVKTKSMDREEFFNIVHLEDIIDHAKKIELSVSASV